MTGIPDRLPDALGRDAALRRVLAAVERDGDRAMLVGGSVRNALLGRAASDIDIATTALPETVLERARDAGLKAVPTGIEHGTVTIVADGRPFEITTLREDIETDGRRAVVRFGRDFSHDARRRDFTINALYADADGRIHDFVGGLPDLAARRLRFIGDPVQRIREDYLRILRFFRFHSEYAEGSLDPEGFAACVRERGGLDQLSRERVRAELLKLLMTRRAAETLSEMDEAGLLALVVGRPCAVSDLAALLRISPQADAGTRLFALLAPAPGEADALRDRLRLSNEETARLEATARAAAEIEGGASGRALRGVAYRHGREAAFAATLVGAARRRETEAPQDAEALIASAPATSPFSGAVMLALGLAAGPLMGRAIAEAEAEWIARDFPGDAAAISDIARRAAAKLLA